MTLHDDKTLSRRRFLEVVATSAAVIPLAGIAGCAGEQDTTVASGSSAPAPKPVPEPSVPPPDRQAERSTPPATGPGELPRLSEDNPQAKALAYVHDASRVDQAAQPRYAPGQLCSNCGLFQASGDEEWAGCPIFAGKAVNANGWCSAYVPKA